MLNTCDSFNNYVVFITKGTHITC